MQMESFPVHCRIRKLKNFCIQFALERADLDNESGRARIKSVADLPTIVFSNYTETFQIAFTLQRWQKRSAKFCQATTAWSWLLFLSVSRKKFYRNHVPSLFAVSVQRLAKKFVRGCATFLPALA